MTIEDLRTATQALESQARDLERSLAQKDFDATEDTRARIGESRKHLRWAADSFDQAEKQQTTDSQS